jgi:hypothetical protein
VVTKASNVPETFQVKVEAMQLTDDTSFAAICEWMKAHGHTPTVISDSHPFRLSIPTAEGTLVAHYSDWVVRGIRGEFYPCSRHAFARAIGPKRADRVIDTRQANSDPIRVMATAEGYAMVRNPHDPRSAPSAVSLNYLQPAHPHPSAPTSAYQKENSGTSGVTATGGVHG